MTYRVVALVDNAAMRAVTSCDASTTQHEGGRLMNKLASTDVYFVLQAVLPRREESCVPSMSRLPNHLD